jgi:hypothetical protein
MVDRARTRAFNGARTLSKNGRWETLQRLAEGEVDAAATGGGMFAVLQRVDAVVRQSRGSAPDDDVPVVKHDAPRANAPLKISEQEFGR